MALPEKVLLVAWKSREDDGKDHAVKLPDGCDTSRAFTII